MKKVIILFADGVEEVEALTQVDYLRRAEIEVNMVSISNNLTITGAHNIIFKAEDFLDKIDGEYDGIIIPGGLKGVENILNKEKAIELVIQMYNAGKLVAAICAGPLVLEKAGVLNGKDFTVYPGLENKILTGNYKKKGTVVIGNIITAAGPIYAGKFAFKIVKYLLGSEASDKLEQEVLKKNYKD